MSYVARQKLIDVFLRIAFVFEPLTSKAISYYLSRKLKEMKKAGIISAFNSKTKRLGKFHYLIVINLDLNSHQTINLIQKIFTSKIPTNNTISRLKKTIFSILRIVYLRYLNQSRK